MTDASGPPRRPFLKKVGAAATSVGGALLAGCSGGGDTTETTRPETDPPTRTATETAEPTDADTPSKTVGKTSTRTKAEPSTRERDDQSDPRVIGYYPAYGRDDLPPDEIPYDELTHLNYSFLKPTRPDGQLIDRSDGVALDDMREQARRRPDTKFLFSVGADKYSGTFSFAASTRETREGFAESALEWLREYDFDGIDVDWEYPTGRVSQDDPKNHRLLLEELRRRFDRADEDYLLSIAGGHAPPTIDPYQIEEFAPVIDHVNVMTYDFHGAWGSKTNFNAPVYVDSNEPGRNPTQSVAAAMEYWAEQPISRDKLVVGLPFYGRIFDGVDAENDGLYQPFDDGGADGYRSLRRLPEDDDWEKHRHDETEVPWLYSESERRFVSYDDPESIRNKAAWEREQNFGGTMCWALSQDYDGRLISAMAGAGRE